MPPLPCEVVIGAIRVSAEAGIAAPPDRVCRILSNYRDYHPRVLPPDFSDFAVEEGGIGAGTVMRFTMTLAGRTRQPRHRVEEPEPGRDLQTTFTVTPNGGGSYLRIDPGWDEAGVQRLVMRLLAPRHEDKLRRLDAYVRGRSD